MTHPITEDEEQDYLFQEMMYARHEIEKINDQIRELQAEKKRFTKRKEETEQALADYMQANGVINFKANKETVTLGESTSVDVPDVEALPDEYVRIKREADKTKIGQALRMGKIANANWFTVAVKPKITVRSK